MREWLIQGGLLAIRRCKTSGFRLAVFWHPGYLYLILQRFCRGFFRLLRIQREHEGELRHFILAGSCDAPVVQLDDLLGDGKA